MSFSSLLSSYVPSVSPTSPSILHVTPILSIAAPPVAPPEPCGPFSPLPCSDRSFAVDGGRGSDESDRIERGINHDSYRSTELSRLRLEYPQSHSCNRSFLHHCIVTKDNGSKFQAEGAAHYGMSLGAQRAFAQRIARHIASSHIVACAIAVQRGHDHGHDDDDGRAPSFPS